MPLRPNRVAPDGPLKPTDHEVVVLGGGPAGCAAATLLAGRGHDVGLVRPSEPPASALAESIPPSARRILDELGALDAVERAGLHPNRGNVAWWAGELARREDFSGGEAGFHTDRASFESVLLGVARGVGVRTYDGTRARAAQEHDDGWTLRCEASTGAMALRAPWLIDATGRRGVLARSEGREQDTSTTTLALVGRWRLPGGWPDGEAHHTLVESYADGWAWSVPLDRELRCFTAMVDQSSPELAGPDVDAMLERELAKTRHIGPGREGAVAQGAAWACSATLYSATRFARPGLLLTGDAGSFIDPLSSFGVKKALSSGWLAGVVAHTALVDPEMAGDAIDFFDAREHELYRTYRAVSVPFFESAAEHHRTTYWRRRAAAARDASEAHGHGHLAPSADVDPDRITAIVPEKDVRRAFEEIRSRARLGAVTSPTLRMVERPGVEGHRIVLREHVASDAYPGGMRYVRGVELPALVRVAPDHPDVPDGWAAYNGHATPVTLPDYLTALATAFAAGFLEHGDA